MSIISIYISISIIFFYFDLFSFFLKTYFVIFVILFIFMVKVFF